MARRTVRARRTSPYLIVLIIICSLTTVVCAVGWIWTYNLKNEIELFVFGQDRVNAASEAGLKSEQMFQAVYDKYPNQGNTLIDIIESRDNWANAYRAEIPRLTKQLTGEELSGALENSLRQGVSDVLKATDDVLAEVSKSLEASSSVGGKGAAELKMTNTRIAMQNLMQRIHALFLVIQADKVTADQLQASIRSLGEQIVSINAEHQRQIAQLQADFTDERARLNAARDSAIAVSQQLQEELKRTIDRTLAIQRQNATEKAALERELSIKQNNLKDLSKEVAQFRKVPTETNIDGHIVSLGPESAVAYADLGRKDGIVLGMTFSLFSVSEIGKAEPKPKAECRVVKIMKDSCELRLKQIQSDSPVVVGDILHNPVYDRERRLRFVLIGKMDIANSGADDTGQLKAMIQELGGRVDDNISVQDDYLIVGETPTVPPTPAAGASPMERQVYEEARKRFIDYSKTVADAENFGIPIMSLNRFLALMGLAGQG